MDICERYHICYSAIALMVVISRVESIRITSSLVRSLGPLVQSVYLAYFTLILSYSESVSSNNESHVVKLGFLAVSRIAPPVLVYQVCCLEFS